MTWFAFAGLNNGKAIDLAGLQEKEAASQGFHGYGTEADAERHPNAINLFTRSLADVLIADYRAATKEGAQPGGPNASIENPGTAARAAIQGDTGLNLTSIEQFLHGLTSANLWVRVAKVTIGGSLLLIGLARLTGADEKVKVIGSTIAKVPFL
jgi:hypothetical protein